jgi:hypothetical protein
MKYNTVRERILELLIILKPIVRLFPTEVRDLISVTGTPVTLNGRKVGYLTSLPNVG